MGRMPEPRWLDDEEQKTWRAFLEANWRLFDVIERELQRDANLPHTYYEILVRLSEAPARTLRMSELASRSLSSRSRISHAIARLEEYGWVCRRASTEDGRGALAILTDDGFAALAAAAPAHVETVRQYLFDRLAPEQVAQLRQISERVLEQFDERCPGVPPESA
jgi:DNA-binding MarR family transcriptional regulator